jgi:hypothetical protein
VQTTLIEQRRVSTEPVESLCAPNVAVVGNSDIAIIISDTDVDVVGASDSAPKVGEPYVAIASTFAVTVVSVPTQAGITEFQGWYRGRI